MTPGSFDERASALRRTLLLGVLLSVPAVFSIKAVDDPDVFWHLRAGEWILEHRAVPATDPFSAFGAGKPWVAYSWLFEVALRELHRLAGFPGIVLATSLASLGLAALLLRLVLRLEPRFSRASALAGVAAVGLLRLASPRPWLVTIAFFLVELQAIHAMRRTGQVRKGLALPLLFVVWANVHIQFVYGLFALGLLALEALVERARPSLHEGKPALAPGPVIALTAACTLATLANPYGIGVWRVVLEYAQGTGAFAAVSELGPLEFRSVADWAVLACVLAGALALGWRRERRLFPYLLLGSSALFAFRAGRDSWFAVIAGVSAAADQGATASEEETFRPGKLALVAIGLGIALELALVCRARAIREPALEAAIARAYPAEACAFIEESALPGPLYNPFDWGGYLIWRLPRLPVAMDGRTNLHGDARIARSLATWAARPGWREDPELAAARVVLAPVDAPLAEVLRTDPRFELAHVDSVALVFRARANR